MKPPRNLRIKGAWDAPLSDWTVATIRSALTQHEAGHFRSSARLIDSMGRDARIAGDLETRVRSLTCRGALPFEVVAPEGGDGRKRSSALQRQRELWWYVCPESEVAPLLSTSIMAGPGLGYLEWTTDASEWIPQLRWLPLHGLSYERYSIGKLQPGFVYTTQDGERLQVTPGDGTWVLHLPNGWQSWLKGCVRSLAFPYQKRAEAGRDWIRYCEKHGLAILKVSEPHWATDDIEGPDGSEGTSADTVYAQWGTLESESTLRLPMGRDKDSGNWDATFLEPVSDTWATFKALLEHEGREIDMVLLGYTDTGAKGGDGELASAGLRNERLQSDAEPLATTLREQVWKPWAEFNYGDRELAGWGRWNTRPAPDMAARATTLKTLGEAVTLLAPAGVDCMPVLEEFGLKAPQGVEVPVPAAPAAPAEEDEAA